MNKQQETIRAWHFTGDKLRDGQPIPKVGEWLEHDGEVILCERGLHASIDPFDALKYAPGAILHLVEISGDIEKQEDKIAGSRRKIVKSINIERELRLFACHCVRNTPLGDGRKVWDLLTDDRSRRAVEVAELFAKGEATSANLAAAGDAAGDAAWAAARDAAGDAAWDAAWAAARAAAWDAAWDAARDAARDWQREAWNNIINEMFED